MKKIEKNILNKIKLNDIKPKSKMFFLLKNISLFLIILLLIFLISLIISFIALDFKILEISNDYYLENNDFFFLAILSLPFYWILTFLILTFLIYFCFKKTKKGYLYQSYLILTFVLSISLILAFSLNKLSADKNFKKRIDKIEYFKDFKIRKEKRNRSFIEKRKKIRPFYKLKKKRELKKREIKKLKTNQRRFKELK